MKTVSLDTAKRLKELGYPQDRMPHWDTYTIHGEAAPTAGELLEWMRKLGVNTPGIAWYDDHWSADRFLFDQNGVLQEATHPDNPAEALGLLAVKILHPTRSEKQ